MSTNEKTECDNLAQLTPSTVVTIEFNSNSASYLTEDTGKAEKSQQNQPSRIEKAAEKWGDQLERDLVTQTIFVDEVGEQDPFIKPPIYTSFPNQESFSLYKKRCYFCAILFLGGLSYIIYLAITR